MLYLYVNCNFNYVKFFLVTGFLLLFGAHTFAQSSSSLAFSVKGRSELYFQRTVLVLNLDSTFLEINESYLSRKLYRKHLPFSQRANSGKFQLVKDTLILFSELFPNRLPEKFIIKSSNCIKYYDEQLKWEAPKCWRRILSPKIRGLKLKKSS